MTHKGLMYVELAMGGHKVVTLVDSGTTQNFVLKYEATRLGLKLINMKVYVNIQREKWKTYGCTIMSNEQIEPTKLSIINFMVY